MKTLAIWINLNIQRNKQLEIDLLNLKYKNKYNYAIYENYINHFYDYYKKYFYNYFINIDHCDEIVSGKRLEEQSTQDNIYKLVNKELENISDTITDHINEYLQKDCFYKYELDNINNYSDNLINMINESISIFKKYNPSTETVFINICNELQNIIVDKYINIPFINYNDFEITKYYKHNSTNSYDYELFCFLRWFIIKDYINKISEEYDRIYIFDNDTFIFDNLNNHEFDLSKPIMSICGCPAFTIVTKQTLNKICDDLLNVYKQNEEKCFDFCLKWVGVISDMAVFNYFVHEYESINYINEAKHLPYFIININDHLVDNQLPKYYYDDNNLLHINNYDENNCNCIGIHFAGAGKKFMKIFYEQSI